MVSRARTLALHTARLERLLTLELALEDVDRNLYDTKKSERQRVSLAYLHRPTFWRDVSILTELGFLPDKESRKERAVNSLVHSIEGLIASGVDALSLTKTQLVEQLGVSYSHLHHNLPTIVSMLLAKY